MPEIASQIGRAGPLSALPLLSILTGALLFTWPAFLNHYPILFSDTGGFLEQALMPDSGWDKPWIYGPFLAATSAARTLWSSIAAQSLILSITLYLLPLPSGEGRGEGVAPERQSTLVHLALCTTLSALSAAPWFTSLLMPDIFAPITALTLFTLMNPTLTPWTRIYLTTTATIAIASHLAHLVIAAACLAALLLLYRRLPWRPAIPLLAALALLLAANLAWFGRLAISPYGAVFALARLVADGPARTYIEESCPAANYRLCQWSGRLPTDSDAFLWDPHGPVWAYGYGPLRIAPEAQQIVRETIFAHPRAVLEAALANTARQLLLAKIGDALVPDHLQVAVAERLRIYFPPAEAARFEASRQAAGTLPALAAPLVPLHQAALLIGTALCALLAAAGWRRTPHLARLAAFILVAITANAAATGALSGPHDRYQARIAWLVLIPPLLYSGGLAASAASRNRRKLRRLNGSMPT